MAYHAAVAGIWMCQKLSLHFFFSVISIISSKVGQSFLKDFKLLKLYQVFSF